MMYSSIQTKLYVKAYVVLFVITFLLGCTFTSFSQSEKKNSINVGLGYPISNHGILAANYSNIFSLNAVVGVSREENGLSLSGFSNIIKENARGFQAAGFSNHIGQTTKGVMMAGFLNTYRSGQGLQAAGFTNIAKEQANGTQMAGFLNKAGNVDGFQIAGFTNMAKDVKGAQIAGFMNIARNVKGVQIAGLLNIADSSDYPIGLINVIKNGEKSIGVNLDETLTSLVSFRSGGRVLYGIVGVGYNFENSQAKYAGEAGIGAHLLRGNKFRLNMELATLHLTDFEKGSYTRIPLRIMPAYKITRNLEIYGGPTINHVFTDTTEGKDLIKNKIWDDTSGKDVQAVYVGFTGGIHIIL